jgi:hypothetical protein
MHGLGHDVGRRVVGDVPESQARVAGLIIQLGKFNLANAAKCFFAAAS